MRAAGAAAPLPGRAGGGARGVGLVAVLARAAAASGRTHFGRGTSSFSAPASCCSRRSRSCSSRCCGDRPGRRRRWRSPSVLVMALAAHCRRRASRSCAVAGRRRAAGADRRQLCRPGRPHHLRQPRGRIALLRRARLQPGLLRRPAVQSASSVRRPGARLRRQPARRDGRRRGEYLSLVTGFNALLVIIALCYVGAVMLKSREFAPPVARV